MRAARVMAVAVADARTRLRRPSTGLLVLVSAVLAWLTISDPTDTAGLLWIAGGRALYTSSTLAFATALLFALLLSLFGFYLVSNALERDLRVRMASVLAATPVRSAEYLLGKLAGNVALLVAVALGYVVAAMAMQVIRGEGPLEPTIYLAHYALLVAPCIAWVAAMALAFECAPGLSGRAGDVLYFFVAVSTFGLGAEPWRKAGEQVSWTSRCLDYSGVGYALSEVQRLFGTSELAIGPSGNPVMRPPFAFPGLAFTPEAAATRALCFVVPVLLFPLALALFRRFDPARTRPPRAGSRRSLLAPLAAVARPIGRPLLALLDHLSPDAALTFRARPILVPLAAASAILGLTLSAASVRERLLPAVFAILSVALADVASRERQAGLGAVVFAAPRRRELFAQWKLATAALVSLLLAGVPTLRLLASEPSAGVSALVGALFLAASAVALGIATGTPKTFTGLSLALWYLALNAKGHIAALDYGGWWASATPLSQAGWAAASVMAAALAILAHRTRLAREA